MLSSHKYSNCPNCTDISDVEFLMMSLSDSGHKDWHNLAQSIINMVSHPTVLKDTGLQKV